MTIQAISYRPSGSRVLKFGGNTFQPAVGFRLCRSVGSEGIVRYDAMIDGPSHISETPGSITQGEDLTE
jgi:hypothetical protein